MNRKLVPERERSDDVVASLAVTLDGYVCRADGAVDYLAKYPIEGFDFSAWAERIGAIVIGSTSYLQAVEWGWSWGDRPTLVLTSREGLPVPEGANVTFSEAPTPQAIARFRQRFVVSGRIWVFGGGRVITEALSGGAVDTLDLTVIPEALGEGVPLFTEAFDGPLRPRDAITFPNGAVRLVFDSSPDGLTA